MGASHVLSGERPAISNPSRMPWPVQPSLVMSGFQIQGHYDRTLKTTSCSRAWSITLRPKSSLDPTSSTDLRSTSRDSTLWLKSVVCPRMWITSPMRSVAPGSSRRVATDRHDADTLLRRNGLRPARGWRRLDCRWLHCRRLHRDLHGFPR